MAPRKPGKGTAEIIQEFKEVTKKFDAKIKANRLLKEKFLSTKQAVLDATKFPDNIKKIKVSD